MNDRMAHDVVQSFIITAYTFSRATLETQVHIWPIARDARNLALSYVVGLEFDQHVGFEVTHVR